MAKKVIAFDIGGTSLRAAVVENNKIVKRLRCDTPKTEKEFTAQIKEYAEELFDSSIEGIGIGCAGVIKDGVIKASPNLPIKNYDMKKVLSKYKVPVRVFNDAGCFSLAELKLGCKKENFLIMTLGTGIGGGIIINGEPYRGGSGLGGEVGHIYVNGVDFESLWHKSKKKMRAQFGQSCLIKDLVKKNSPESQEILVEIADYLGKGIASMISVLDPEIVILAGGPSESGAKFIHMVQKKVDEYRFLPKRVLVRWTKLSHPGLLGASLLVS